MIKQPTLNGQAQSQSLGTSIPSQAYAKKSKQDHPVRTMITQEKSSISSTNNNNQQQLNKMFGRVKDIESIMDRGRKLKFSSLAQKCDTSQLKSSIRVENVNLIEQYESRLASLIMEQQALQDQLFKEQQKHHQVLIDYDHQFTQLDLQMQSEKKNVEQFKLLITSKNDEVRQAHKDIELLERKCQEQLNILTVMSQDVDRSKSMLENRQCEMDGWKGQQIERDRNHVKEINRFKGEFDYAQNLELKTKETIKEEVSRFEELIRQQSDENRLLKEQFLAFDREIEALQHVVLENESCRLQTERAHQQELDEMRLHYDYVRKQILDRELNELMMQHQNERMMLETTISLSTQRVFELDTKLLTMQSENQKITERLKQKGEECDAQKQKYEQLDKLFSSQSIELQGMRTQLLQEESDNQRIVQILQNEHQQHRIQIEQQQQIIIELEEAYRRQKDEHEQNLNSQNDQHQDHFNAQLMEHNKTRQQLTKAQTDIDVIKVKYITLEQSRLAELTDYTQDFESSKLLLKDQLSKAVADKSLLESTSKLLKQRISDYETQRIELEYKLKQHALELDEYKEQKDVMHQRLNQDKLTHQQTQKTLKEKIQQSDQTCQDLEVTIQRLEQSVQEMQNQGEADRVQYVQQKLQLEQQCKSLKQTITQMESSQRAALDETIDKGRIEQGRQKELYLITIRSLTEEISVHKKQSEISLANDLLEHSQAQDEISKLRLQIKQQESELKDSRRQNEDLETELSEEIEELTIQIEYFTKQQLDQKDWEIKFNAERISLETQISSLKTKYEDEKVRAETAVQEVRRLEDILHYKLKEIDHLRHQLGTTKLTDEEYEELQRKLASMHDEIYDMQQDRLKLNNEKANQEKAVLRLQSEVQLKESEVQQVYDLMNKRRQEQDGQGRDEMDGIKRENQRLIADMQDQDATIKGRQDQIEELKREKEELVSLNQQLKRQMTMLEEQGTLKHKTMMDKISELDNLKLKYEDQWKQGGGVMSQRMSIMRQSVAPEDLSADKRTSLSQARINRSSIRQNQF